MSLKASFSWMIRALLAVLAATLLASVYVEHRFEARIVSLSEAPNAPVGLVFGAGLASRGAPSAVLLERIRTATALYHQGKVQKLLLSGDDSERHHGETLVMQRSAQSQGLPPEALIRDPLGRSTYESCYRAKHVFGVQRALLVTQGFHLPRALFIANSLGIDAYGVATDASGPSRPFNRAREVFARAWALIRIGVHHFAAPAHG